MALGLQILLAVGAGILWLVCMAFVDWAIHRSRTRD
jgi:hypothetical protein